MNKRNSNTTAARIQVNQDTGVPSARTRDMLTSFDTLPSSQRDANPSENTSCADNCKTNNINRTKAIRTQPPLGFRKFTIQESHQHAPQGMLTSFDTLRSSQRDANPSENRSCADNSKSNNINGTIAIRTQLLLGFR